MAETSGFSFVISSPSLSTTYTGALAVNRRLTNYVFTILKLSLGARIKISKEKTVVISYL
jgi:hypothetical protein